MSSTLDSQGTPTELSALLAPIMAETQASLAQAARQDSLAHGAAAFAIVGLLASLLAGFAGYGWPVFSVTLAAGVLSLGLRRVAQKRRLRTPDPRRLALVDAALEAARAEEELSLKLGLARADRPETREGGPASQVFRDPWLELRLGGRALLAEETLRFQAMIHAYEDGETGDEGSYTTRARRSRTVFQLVGAEARPPALPDAVEVSVKEDGVEVVVERAWGEDVARLLGRSLGAALAG